MDQKCDQEGHYVFHKGDLAGRRITLASIYLTNRAQLSCLEEILNALQGFMEGEPILGGDFYMALDPLLDASRLTTHLSYPYLRWVKKALPSTCLVDVWRIHHPNDHDYTFYSSSHDSYSRIDYVMVS